MQKSLNFMYSLFVVHGIAMKFSQTVIVYRAVYVPYCPSYPETAYYLYVLLTQSIAHMRCSSH